MTQPSSPAPPSTPLVRAPWFRSELEVELRLPALRFPEAHDALITALHRETGLVGSARADEEALRWHAHAEPAVSRLEVRLERDGEGSRLLLWDHALAQRPLLRGLGPMALVSTFIGLYAIDAAPMLGAMVSLPLILLFTGALMRFATWRKGQQLADLAQALGRQLPRAPRGEYRANPPADEDPPAPGMPAFVTLELLLPREAEVPERTIERHLAARHGLRVETTPHFVAAERDGSSVLLDRDAGVLRIARRLEKAHRLADVALVYATLGLGFMALGVVRWGPIATGLVAAALLGPALGCGLASRLRERRIREEARRLARGLAEALGDGAS